MKAYMAFTRKEFTEFTRTYKLMILGLVFLFFGIMSPLAAKDMPEIISEFMPAGMEIALTTPTALDAWMQFFKNVSQLGLLVAVILFGGIMSSEYSRGTLIHMLTKGLPRRTVVLAKFTAASLLWTAAYLLCFGTAYGYTWYYWRADAGMEGLYVAIAATWLYGIFLLSITILGSVLFRNSYGCLLFTGIAVVLQILLNMIPKIKEFNPMELITEGTPLLQGQVESTLFLKPTVVGCIGTLICVTLSCIIFNKKKL